MDALDAILQNHWDDPERSNVFLVFYTKQIRAEVSNAVKNILKDKEFAPKKFRDNQYGNRSRMLKTIFNSKLKALPRIGLRGRPQNLGERERYKQKKAKRMEIEQQQKEKQKEQGKQPLKSSKKKRKVSAE